MHQLIVEVIRTRREEYRSCDLFLQPIPYAEAERQFDALKAASRAAFDRALSAADEMKYPESSRYLDELQRALAETHNEFFGR